MEHRTWYDTARLYCAACGAMLHGRYWRGGEHGDTPYCTPACEALKARIEHLYASRRETGVSSLSGRTMTDCVVSLDALRLWSEEVLKRAGASKRAATATAEVLVDANRRGLDSHGVMQLRFYLPALYAGATRGVAVPEVACDLPAVAIVDGHDGLGPFVARFAMDLCCRKASDAGAAVVGVRNSSHFGAASCYAEQAAAQSCLAIVLSNSDPGMSPPGGLGPILGTNPLAVAAPLLDGQFASLDIATSVAALSKVVLAANQAHELPPAGRSMGKAGRLPTRVAHWREQCCRWADTRASAWLS